MTKAYAGIGAGRQMLRAADRPRPRPKHHPTWDTLSRGARQLHARNSHQVLGLFLDTPVEFVVCWTPGGKGGGGTGQALRIARAHGIKVFDLADDAQRAKVERWVGHANR